MTHHYGSERSPYHGVPMQDIVDTKRKRRMDEIDALPPRHRALVHDYGYNVVKTLIDCGVSKPSRIKHVVETILNEFSPTRGTFSQQGARGEKLLR